MLQKLLGSHVVPVSAVKKTGIEALLDHVARIYENKIAVPRDKISYSEEIEEALTELQGLLETDVPLSARFSPRWLAVKLLENDQFAYSVAKESPVWLRLKHKLPGLMNTLEGRLKERIGQRISEDRHAFARGAYKETVRTEHEEKKTITDQIDSVVLNRFLGVPLSFIMWLIFQVTFTFGEVPVRLESASPGRRFRAAAGSVLRPWWWTA